MTLLSCVPMTLLLKVCGEAVCPSLSQKPGRKRLDAGWREREEPNKFSLQQRCSLVN